MLITLLQMQMRSDVFEPRRSKPAPIKTASVQDKQQRLGDTLSQRHSARRFHLHLRRCASYGTNGKRGIH